MEKAYLSTEQAGEFLGVTGTAVRQWTNKGKLPAVKTPGGHRRIEAAALRDYMVAQGFSIPERLIAIIEKGLSPRARAKALGAEG